MKDVVATRFCSARLPIQAPVLDRLGDMMFMNVRAAIQVSNGRGHLEDAGIGAGRKAETVGDQ